MTVEQYKNEFISILNSLRVDANIEGLIKFLEEHNFFTAPSSTQYQYSFEGGLCAQSIAIYRIFSDLAHKFLVNYELTIDDKGNEVQVPKYLFDEDSIIILGLLCMVYKMDYYEMYIKNEKYYSDKGSKCDNLGKFDWVSTKAYKVKDIQERMLFGDGAFTSYMFVNRFIPLTELESIIMVNYGCGIENGYQVKEMWGLMSKYPLLTLLHSANLISNSLPEI